MDSILSSVKKMLGIDEFCDSFDQDLIIHINSTLVVLNQLGVGPAEGYFIKDTNDKWVDFIGDDKTIEIIKSYVYMKVRLLFDPPQSSAAIEAMNNLVSEFEWRIQVAVDPASFSVKGGI